MESLTEDRKAFEMRYLAQNSEEVETWLKNTIVLISKKKTMNRLEDREEESMCRVCWPNGIVDAPSILLEMELGEVEKRDKSWRDIRIFGFTEGRSAIEISTAIRPMAAVAREWGPELGFIACSLDVKPAFDNVSPENLSLVMKEMGIDPILARAMLREQIG